MYKSYKGHLNKRVANTGGSISKFTLGLIDDLCAAQRTATETHETIHDSIAFLRRALDYLDKYTEIECVGSAHLLVSAAIVRLEKVR